MELLYETLDCCIFQKKSEHIMPEGFMRRLEGTFKIDFGTIFHCGILDSNLNLLGMKMRHIIKLITMLSVSNFSFFSCAIFQPDILSNIKPVERVNMIEVEKESNLDFDIQTDSTVYQNEKPIFLKMRITNKGDSSIFINKSFIVNTPEAPKESAIGEVYLIINSPTGDTLSFNAFVHVNYPSQSDYIKLDPGEEIVSAHKDDINRYYDFSKSGEYIITGYYYNFYKEGIKPTPWEGKIKSNTITILIP